MSVETTAPFRRVVGTLIRGVADGLLGGAQGIPLAGAQVTATASVKSAASGEFIVLDPVDGTTDQNARLRNATTGEDGILLLVTDDPSIGVIGWTWHITVTAPSLNRPGLPPRAIEFDIDVPSGEGDLDLATLVPVPGNVGEDVILWRAAVEQTAANLAESEAIVATSVDDARLDGDDLELIRRDGSVIPVGNIRGREGKSAYELWLEAGNTGTVEDWQADQKGRDGSNVLPTDEAISEALTVGAPRLVVADSISRRTATILATSETNPDIDETGAAPSQVGLSALLASAPRGSRVILRGDYLLTGSVIVPGDRELTIDAEGASITCGVGTYTESCAFYGKQEFEQLRTVSSVGSASVSVEDVVGVAVTTLTVPGMSALPLQERYRRFDIVKVIADDVIPGGHFTSNDRKPRVGEFAQVHDVQGDVVYLRNTLMENYVTRPRVARIPYATARIYGGTWDVTDELFAMRETLHWVRFIGFTNPIVSRPRWRRLMGMGVSVKSCNGYTVVAPECLFAMNDVTVGILGYGIHDSSSMDGWVQGGEFRAMRHAYTDGTNFSLAPDDPLTSNPADFGSTINAVIRSATARDCTAGGFDTHSMAYGVKFVNCTSHATSVTHGFQLRGRACEVRDCTVYGGYSALFIFTQATTSGGTEWSPGESHRHYVSNLRAVGSTYGIYAQIHTSAAHPLYDVIDAVPTAVIHGLMLDGTRAIMESVNGRFSMRNVYWRAGPTVGGSVWSLKNTWLDAEDVTYDATGVTNVASTVYLGNVDAVSGGRNWSSDVRIRRARLMESTVFKDAVTTLYNAGNSGTRRVEVTEHRLDDRTGGTESFLSAHANVQRAVGWDLPFSVGNAVGTGRSSSSGIFSGSQIAAASALRTLTSAVDAHLVATVNITDSVARTMSALTAGRRDGQALTIILGSATASLTVPHGASANTRLNGGIDKVLSGGNARCDLVWSQGAWRELA